MVDDQDDRDLADGEVGEVERGIIRGLQEMVAYEREWRRKMILLATEQESDYESYMFHLRSSARGFHGSHRAEHPDEV